MKHLKSRKYTILVSFLIAYFVLIHVVVVNWVLQYNWRSPVVLRSPMVKKELISPLSNEAKASPKKQSLLPQEPVAHAEVPVSKDSLPGNTGQELNEDSLKTLVLSYFPKDQHEAVIELIHRESTWNPHAVNPSSGATGLFQALPWSKTGCDSTDNIACQAAWGSAYIESRYGTAQNALRFHDQKGWY